MTEESEEVNPANGVFLDAAFILEYLNDWSRTIGENPAKTPFESIENNVQQMTLENFRSFIFETVAQFHKHKLEEAFKLPPGEKNEA